jgi:hypothetical protein
LHSGTPSSFNLRQLQKHSMGADTVSPKAAPVKGRRLPEAIKDRRLQLSIQRSVYSEEHAKSLSGVGHGPKPEKCLETVCPRSQIKSLVGSSP